jgi:hypothetical protein
LESFMSVLVTHSAPGLSAGFSPAFSQHAEATQVSKFAWQPDVQFNQIWQTNCCECAEAAQAALAVQAKNSTFTIAGSISVIERVYSQREKGLRRTLRAVRRRTQCASPSTRTAASTLSPSSSSSPCSHQASVTPPAAEPSTSPLWQAA